MAKEIMSFQPVAQPFEQTILEEMNQNFKSVLRKAFWIEEVKVEHPNGPWEVSYTERYQSFPAKEEDQERLYEPHLLHEDKERISNKRNGDYTVTITRGKYGQIPVIVKRYNTHYSVGANEALLQRRVECNYTCRVLAVFMEPSMDLVLVLEQLERDLEQDIASRQAPYTELEVMTMLYCVTESFMSAKLGGVAHRDIKPSNIFLIDSELFCKLGDWGCAINISSRQPSFVGTDGYFSPEMSAARAPGGSLDFDPILSDVFSLGMTIMHMTTRMRPPADLVENQTRLEEWVDTTLQSLQYSEGLKRYVKEMLQFRPEDRPCIEEITFKVKNYFSYTYGALSPPAIMFAEKTGEDPDGLLRQIELCLLEVNYEGMNYALQFFAEQKRPTLRQRMTLFLLTACVLWPLGRYMEARRLIESTLSEASQQAEECLQERKLLLLMLAAVYYKLEKPQLAQKIFSELKLSLGVLLLGMINPGSLIEVVEQISPERDAYSKVLSLAYLSQDLGSPEVSELLFRKALLLKKSQCEHAGELMALCDLMESDEEIEFLGHVPLDIVRLNRRLASGLCWIYKGLANLYVKQKKKREAERLLAKIVTVNKCLYGPYYMGLAEYSEELAYISKNEMYVKKCIAYLTQFFNGDNTSHVRLYLYLAERCVDKGELAEAIQFYERADRIPGKMFNEYIFCYKGFIDRGLARIYFLLGKFEEAAQRYNSALKVSVQKQDYETEKIIFRNLAYVYKVQGKEKESAKVLQGYILALDREPNPNSEKAEAHRLLAQVSHQETAKIAYAKAAELYSKSEELLALYTEQALHFLDEENWEEAEAAFQKVLELNSEADALQLLVTFDRRKRAAELKRKLQELKDIARTDSNAANEFTSASMELFELWIQENKKEAAENVAADLEDLFVDIGHTDETELRAMVLRLEPLA